MSRTASETVWFRAPAAASAAPAARRDIIPLHEGTSAPNARVDRRPPSRHLVRITIAIWIAIAVMAVGRAALVAFPRHCGCFWIYADAGRAWLNGADLYSPREGLDVYRYSPLVAAMLAPVGAAPTMLGSAMLRAANLTIFFMAIWRWAKSAAPIALDLRRRLIFLLLVAPLAARSLADAQFNGMTIGLIVFGITALAEERPNRAAVCLVLACFVKVYAVALVMVLCLLYPRRLPGRFFAMAVIAAALPFLLQGPQYVARQYELWVRWGLNNRDMATFQDVRFVLVRFGLHLTHSQYLVLEVAAGLGVAAICAWQRAIQLPRLRLLNAAMSLTCGWMLLCGPATEDCTYILLAPAMAWAALAASIECSAPAARGLAYGGFGLFTFGQFAYWFPWGSALNSLGVFPAAGLLTTASILATLFWPVSEQTILVLPMSEEEDAAETRTRAA